VVKVTAGENDESCVTVGRVTRTVGILDYSRSYASLIWVNPRRFKRPKGMNSLVTGYICELFFSSFYSYDDKLKMVLVTYRASFWRRIPVEARR